MKKILQLIFIVIGLTSCEAQEVSGTWMSYQNYVIDMNSMYTSGNEGVLIDFDNQTIGTINSDSIVAINIDFKQSKLLMKTDTLNVDFKVYQKDSIEIDFGQNMMHVFRPLNLNHKLNTNKNLIKDFLVKNKFEKINGEIDIKFSDKFFFRDVMFEKPNKKNALINKSWDDEGYWLIKEIKQNFFLLFTLDQTTDQNIYQITSIDKCVMKLKQLQDAKFGSAHITELKTCL
ncbi:hypothetical protein [Formosa algae]|uniref:hypothetical protein n=1 Tax=Formosa algae TaxID=225843 RepID=UPI000CCEAF89|nr:hypothetical protein [Formosa algae]PNW27026.1 hypothetical protein BKP44_14605 [Formosa algae]